MRGAGTSRGTTPPGSGGAPAPVAAHTIPCDHQERGIVHEVEAGHPKRRPDSAAAHRCSFVRRYKYPVPRPLDVGGPRNARIHKRISSPVLSVAANTGWAPSPCDRLSRPRTTTGPPPPATGAGRRRTCPPAHGRPPNPGGNRQRGSHVHHVISRRDRHPVMPLHLRRDRAADVGLGLPAGDFLRPGSSPAAGAPAAGCAMRPNPHPPDSGLVGISLRGFQPLVPLRMPLRLASRARTIWQNLVRPVVVGAASRPHPRPGDRAAPCFNRPAATGRPRCPFITS